MSFSSPLERPFVRALDSVFAGSGFAWDSEEGGVLWTPNMVAPANRRFWGRGDTIAGTTTVTAWNDVWGGSAFTPTGSPARNTGDSNYVGGVSIGFVEASSQFLTGPGAAAFYKDLHDVNVPVTIGGLYVDADPTDDTQVLWGTNNTVATSVGHLMRRRAASAGYVGLNGNGTSQDSFTVNSVATPGTPQSLVYERVGLHFKVFANATLIVEGDWPSLSTADPAGVLRLGVRAVTNTEFFEGTMGEFTWFTEARGLELATYLETR